MNGEELIKRAILSPLSENDQIKAIKAMAELEIEQDAEKGLTREQQLDKALGFILGMLKVYMSDQQQQNNVTLAYARLVAAAKA